MFTLAAPLKAQKTEMTAMTRRWIIIFIFIFFLLWMSVRSQMFVQSSHAHILASVLSHRQCGEAVGESGVFAVLEGRLLV